MLTQVTFPNFYPIFVVGTARSGTTLLQLILNSHPEIAIYGELHYFDKILPLKKQIPSLESLKDLDAFFSLVIQMGHIQYIPDVHNILQSVHNRMANQQKRSYDHFYTYVLQEFARAQRARRFGEKTPHNIRYLNELIHLFPNAKLLHIVRDPRDVVASLTKMPWTSNDIVTNSLKWKSDILHGQYFDTNRASYCQLHYEDLLSNPRRQIKHICEFIGEQYYDTMMAFYRTSKTYIRNEPWKEGTSRQINTSATNKWKQELSDVQVFIVQKITGWQMSRLGYEKKKIRLTAKLVSPFIFLRDIGNYISYKSKNNQYRTKAIVGENKRLYQMLVKSIIKSIPYRRLFK